MADAANKSPIEGFSGWNEVRSAIEAIISSQAEVFDPNTIANARDVVSVCESLTRLPAGVGKGYLTTVCLWWKGNFELDCLCWDGFELEVFEDRVEVYAFRDKATYIRHEEHTPGGSLTPRFLDELAALAR